jgi:hypothetical protein
MSYHSGQQILILKFRERLAVKIQTTLKFLMERPNFKKLNDAEGKEEYRFEILYKFATLEILDNDVDINTAWETIRGYNKISVKASLHYYYLKKHASWFEERCSKLLVRRKQTKLQ